MATVTRGPDRGRLLELLVYDPETGVFTWRVNVGDKIKAGAVAGRRHTDGYWDIGFDWRRWKSARLAFLYMEGRWPRIVDHRNGVRDDDRWVNLRVADTSQNAANKARQSNNTSGQPGVWKIPETGRWRARVTFRGKSKSLGCFKSFDEACAAYRRGAQALFGEFVREA